MERSWHTALYMFAIITAATTAAVMVVYHFSFWGGGRGHSFADVVLLSWNTEASEMFPNSPRLHTTACSILPPQVQTYVLGNTNLLLLQQWPQLPLSGPPPSSAACGPRWPTACSQARLSHPGSWRESGGKRLPSLSPLLPPPHDTTSFQAQKDFCKSGNNGVEEREVRKNSELMNA